MPRSFESDFSGPYNHAERGGWYFHLEKGTPTHMRVMNANMKAHTTLVMAMGVPKPPT